MSPLRHLPVSPHLPTARVDLAVGDRVRLANGETRRWWWSVAATSAHFAVVTHQVPFQPRGTLCYSVLDWRRGRRGPCNLIGQAFGDGSYSSAQCAALLAAFEAGEVEVSHRNSVPLTVLEFRAAQR